MITVNPYKSWLANSMLGEEDVRRATDLPSEASNHLKVTEGQLKLSAEALSKVKQTGCWVKIFGLLNLIGSF